MSHKAVLKLGPIAASTVLLSPSEGRTSRFVYDRTGLRLKTDAPVLINHDVARAIGHVLELTVWPDTDGDWLVARCVVDEGLLFADVAEDPLQLLLVLGCELVAKRSWK